MLCQMPGCKNKAIKNTTKDGIFSGIYLNNIKICTCEKHSSQEIETVLQNKGEEKAAFSQFLNPFCEIPKISTKIA